MSVARQKMKHPRKKRDQVVLRKGWAPTSGKVSPLMAEAYAAEKARLIGEGFHVTTDEDERRLHALCWAAGNAVLREALRANAAAQNARRQAEHKALCDARWEAREEARKAEKKARMAATERIENIGGNSDT